MYSGLFLYHTYCLDDSFYKSTGRNFHWNLGCIVPLSIGCAPFIARLVENSLLEVPNGLIRNGKSSWASPQQIISKVLLPEALPSLINNATITLITLVGYSAMGGAVGAGGLGQVGYQYGYIGYNAVIMNTVLLLLIAWYSLFSLQETNFQKNSIIDKIKRMKRFTLLSLITIALLFLYYPVQTLKKIILIILK